jgi:adhesin transport system membrane fusion protein
MLNISKTNISGKINKSKLKSFNQPQYFIYKKIVTKVILVILFLNIILLFLPWTQNIASKGFVTTLEPDKRPQEINSVIAGKIEKWFVREGYFVNKGDTIIHLSEIRDEFFDPKIIERTQEQLNAKELSVNAYVNKVQAAHFQIKALHQIQGLKLKQAKNKLVQANLKVESDSIKYEASLTNFKIASNQFERAKELLEKGIISKNEFENRQRNLQNNEATLIERENTLLQSRNNKKNVTIEIDALQKDFENKIASTQSDKYSAIGDQLDAQGGVAKYKNTIKNLQVREKFHYITAPQSGFITNITKAGIGEVFNEGETIVTIMPVDYELAVEMYVKPVDISLFEIGQKTRIVFDGWPSIIFSGWPNVTFGTFGGTVVAIDRYISDNGKYRVMVAPDKEDAEWPHEINVGSGAQTISLLNTVPVWYELWRQLNGFPEYFYTRKPTKEKHNKKEGNK